MEILGFPPLQIPCILLGGVQETGLVEGFFNRGCPKIKVPCEVKEMDQYTWSRRCPWKMKCCQFNCAKKCVTPKEDVCSLPQVVGPCVALLPCCWYDKDTRACSKFIYGGCQGNNNNFQSESACKAFSLKKC